MTYRSGSLSPIADHDTHFWPAVPDRLVLVGVGRQHVADSAGAPKLAHHAEPGLADAPQIAHAPLPTC
jgi:hypothetical protein